MAQPPQVPHIPADGSFELALRAHHLEELRQVEIPTHRMPNVPWPKPPGAPSPYDQLVEWSKQARSQIQVAVANRQFTFFPL